MLRMVRDKRPGVNPKRMHDSEDSADWTGVVIRGILACARLLVESIQVVKEPMAASKAYLIYRCLYARFGPQHWWPARSRLEMMVGAILTQHTAWENVERAVLRLRREQALSLSVLAEVSLDTLAEWVRPAGYFRVKARRLQAFARFCVARFGTPGRTFRLPTHGLRTMLLAVHGIGPETADSMLLYAGRRPVFVIDTYTRRMLQRHGWLPAGAEYEQAAAWFTRQLPCDAPLFNEYHALLVRLGKDFCRAQACCMECPLKRFLPAAAVQEGVPA